MNLQGNASSLTGPICGTIGLIFLAQYYWLFAADFKYFSHKPSCVLFIISTPEDACRSACQDVEIFFPSQILIESVETANSESANTRFIHL